ncbi:hypothetical protein Epro_0890 [Endomicrobium proavitum]|uniref:Uncharacterized protein n=1 Tax=Endomicrobium proavitum TaxID=1408281 RepID=A0A0G3WL88_9BACT|nr:hypothetical protein Epro_0890 [Endomicrobium proavitum]
MGGGKRQINGNRFFRNIFRKNKTVAGITAISNYKLQIKKTTAENITRGIKWLNLERRVGEALLPKNLLTKTCA